MKRGLVTPVTAEGQDRGGRRSVRAGRRVTAQRIKAGADPKRGCEADGRGQPRETISAVGTRSFAREVGKVPRIRGRFYMLWAVACVAGAQRTFDDLKPTQVLLVPYLCPVK